MPAVDAGFVRESTAVNTTPKYALDLRQVLGRSCLWLYGAVRQQCAGHLPFARRATANGGFSVLPTGTTDPVLPFIQPNDQ